MRLAGIAATRFFLHQFPQEDRAESIADCIASDVKDFQSAPSVPAASKPSRPITLKPLTSVAAHQGYLRNSARRIAARGVSMAVDCIQLGAASGTAQPEQHAQATDQGCDRAGFGDKNGDVIATGE